MLSKATFEELHRALDAATLALEDVRTHRITNNFEQVEAAIDTLTRELGNAKFALRGVTPDA